MSDHPAGSLLSVNVGMPKDVAWRGKTVFTGVFKEPVDRPRRVRRLNVDGDGQGDLAGTAASSAPSSSTRSTRTATGSASSGADDFVYGQFGENFTVDGLQRRRGLHRRPLPDRHRALRGHPAARHLLPRRDPDGRPAHPRAARLAPPPGLLLPGARGGRRAGGRRDRQGRRGSRADDGRRGRRAALPPRAPAPAAAARAAHPRAQPRLAGAPSAPCSTETPAAATPA